MAGVMQNIKIEDNHSRSLDSQAMSKAKLDKSEQALLAAFEEGEFKSVLTPARKKMVKRVAKHFAEKDKRASNKCE